MHIPIYEYVHVVNNYEYYGKKMEPIGCQAENTGVFSALLEQKIAEWVVVGHDHNNDQHGKYRGINLAYGRKTGYGCYMTPELLHGARVFEVSFEPEYSIKTWFRQEDGSKFQYQEPSKRNKNAPPQTACYFTTEEEYESGPQSI